MKEDGRTPKAGRREKHKGTTILRGAQVDLSGQHQHRDIPPGRPDPPADLKAVQVRQPEIQDHQGDIATEVGERGHRRPAGANRVHPVALTLQGPRQRMGDRQIVLDQQHHRHPNHPTASRVHAVPS